MKPNCLVRNPFTVRASLTAVMAAALGAPLAQAVAITWNGANNATWGLNTNWTPTSTPTSADDLTILGPLNVAGPLNIDIAAAAAAKTIAVTDTSAVSLSNTTSGADQTLTLATGLTTGTGAVTIGSTTANQGVNIALTATNAWSVGAGGLTVNNTISGTTFGITKSGAGTLTLAGANNYTGVTSLTAGTLVLANASALGGTSNLLISNTGTVVDIATNGGDTPFTVNAGAGTTTTILSNRATAGAGINHTLGNGAFSAVTINVQKGANVTSGTASLTFAAVSLTSGTANAVTTFNPTTANVLIGSAATSTNNVAHTLGLDGTTAGNEVTGIISNGLTAAVSVLKSNTSTWTLGGSNTYTGNTIVRGGTLVTNGTYASGSTGTAGPTTYVVDGSSTANAKMVIANNYTAFRIFLGDRNTTGSVGALYQTAGDVLLTQNASVDDFRVGSNTNGQGYYQISGGKLTANEIGIAASLANTVGVVDVKGGTLISNGYLAVGRGTSATKGLLNVTGGTVNYGATLGTGPLDINWGDASGAAGVVNVGGGLTAAAVTGVASVTATSTFAGKGLNLAAGNTAGTTGIVNLLTNGTLTVSDVVATNANPNSLLNFNGGTLKATATNLGANFFTGTNVDAVRVYNNGGTIDNNGTAISVGAAILAPTDSGVTTIAVTNGGSGYVGAPFVSITGGTGSGATAFANMIDDGSGNGTYKVDSITVTNRGVYTAAPTTVTLSSAGTGATAATVGAIATAANTSGGMTFTGTSAGTTTLTGGSTFSGNVSIKGGTKVVANLANNFFNPTNSALGNNQAVRDITLSESSTLQFNSGDTLGGNNSTIVSKIVIGAGSTVTNGGNVFNRLGSVTLNGGTLTSTSGAAAGYQTYSFDANAVVTVGGTVASTISSAGAFNGIHLHSNTEFNVADSTLSAATDLTVSAPLIDRNASDAGAGGFNKTGAGTMILTGVNTHTGVTTVSNGTLALGVGGTIANSSTIDVKSGATLDTTAQSGWTLATGQTLKGDGTVNAGGANSLTVGGGAFLAPGGSPGTLTVTGTLGFDALSTFSAEIAPSTITSDLVNVSGGLNVNATAILALSLFGSDSVLADGTKLTLIDYAGSWNNVAFAGFGDDTSTVLGLNTYRVDYNDPALGGTAFTLTVIPEPGAATLIGSLGGLGLLRRRRNG